MALNSSQAKCYFRVIQSIHGNVSEMTSWSSDIVKNVFVQGFEHNKHNCVHVCYIELDTENSKPQHMKPKLSSWIDNIQF